MSVTENNRYIVQVFVGALSAHYEALSVEASKQTTSEEIVSCIVERLALSDAPGASSNYELAEVVGNNTDQECKERRLGPTECPVALMLLWPLTQQESYRFYLREKLNDYIWSDNFAMDPQLIKDYFYRFLYQPKDKEYPDLCQLPDLNEQTLLDNLRARFNADNIYTYVGSILIAVNPFKFHPIYNPKYVKLYQNTRLCPNLPPHIFAVADTAYHCMLKERKNQCIVISGESGSGKTESTNFLLHHLTALSQKGSHGSGVEQTILSAGPVLEAFGNAKTAHNNNSSRFGKFIQVNYKENGMVHGAVVQKYLLEKSRICSQGRNERNYHVFYYLLAGASELERQQLHLKTSEEYKYLRGSGCYVLDNVDEKYEFSRLKQSMEMVGFTAEKQKRLFSVLSAVLLLGNIEFQPRKSAYHHDEAVAVKNPEIVQLISELLRVKQETLLQALTAKRARASGETLIISYRLPEAIAARDAMAKCLYGALFDWIVLQVNHALLSKKDTFKDHQGHSIGVLDIFGFEDFGLCNSFEQLCINYANEHLQYYFNQHVFKYEQEEYRKEGIRWTNIEFMDNTGCLQLIEGKPNGLLCVLDDQCNFPGATNETLLQKFNTVHKDNQFYEKPQRKEAAFMVRHYAGKVKYQVSEMREKNLDLMRQDIVGVLKNSSMAFVRELVGADPVAVFRWAIVRAFFRGYFAFHEAGRRHRQARSDPQHRYRNHIPNENLIRKNKSFRPREKGKKGLKNLQTVKTLAGRTGLTSGSQGQLGKARKQPLTVAAQFQQSLHSLLDTLNQANPFFIRCIKSNANKIPNKFDEETVQRQLRYTGMLETVRIRQAGFNVRLTYDEFIQLYRILLPKGLLSSQNDVKNFLLTLNLNRDNYQLGTSKIFLRESEKVKLDYKLHQQIMASIITIQRWFRSCLERRKFLRLKNAAVAIQSCWKMYSAQRTLAQLRARICAVVTIQSVWRGYKIRKWYTKLKKSVIVFQSHARGYLTRKSLSGIRSKFSLTSRKIQIDQVSIAQSTDEAFVSKESSQEELDKPLRDSDESSGIQEDGDVESSSIKSGSVCRPTFTLPTVAPTSVTRPVIQIAPQLPVQRIQDKNVNQELLLHVGTCTMTKRRLSKAHRSVDLSDLDYLDEPAYKGSVESLVSQQSSDSALDPSAQSIKSNVQSLNLKSGFKDSDGTYVASPVFVMSAQYLSGDNVGSGDMAWRTSTSLVQDTACKISVTRSPQVSQQHRPLSISQSVDPKPRITDSGFTRPKYSSDDTTVSKEQSVSKREIRTVADGLIVLPPVRRNAHQIKRQDVQFNRGRHSLNQSKTVADQLEQSYDIDNNKMSMPEVPTRLSRKPRRDALCRSLGEEVTDNGGGTVEARNPALLGTIGETNVLSYSTNTPIQPVWTTKKSIAEATDTFRKSESECTGKYVSPGKRARSGNSGLGLELRRRNSDPATKIGATEPNPAGRTAPGEDLEWKSPDLFTIAGHRFRKVARFSKDDRCVYCHEEMDAFVTQGHKCVECKQLFHTKCIQNRGVLQMPCKGSSSESGKPGRRKHRKHSRTPYDLQKQAAVSKFSLTGTSEFTDSTDKIISDARELQSMQDFITKKIYKMESEEGNKPSEVDRVFKHALREFKDNLVQTYSVVNKQGAESLNIKYKDLIANFLHVMETVCVMEDKHEDFPVTMGVNAFRGFMNEFMTSRNDEKPSKAKRKKEKKRKIEDPIIFAGHSFMLTIINIPTACEICTSFFMWPIERGLVCQSCRLTCHKKCYAKVTAPCGKDPTIDGHINSPRVFGVPLCQLLTGEGKVPPIVDRLITTIEIYGLYTEGIYRKPGVNSKVKELKAKMEECGQDIRFEDYQVHVLASVLKSFLREMPEPLLTFDCYEDFLRAANLHDPQDRVSTLFAIIKKLPKPNFDLMERLIFHLARVALHEEANRMNASSLAIVFAPCILRTNKPLPAQDSLQDIGRQTQCVETIISEQMRKVKATLADIETLDTACHTATHRLSSLRSSKVFSPEELLPASQINPVTEPHSPLPSNGDDEEALLVSHIQEIQNEKALLTSALPSLTRTTSDDDLLSTDLDGDGEGSMDDISCGTPSMDTVTDRGGAPPRRTRWPVVRSVSGGDNTHPHVASQLKRQSSTDIALIQKAVEECSEDAPIMV